ncbi:pentatricopeptide repeat-containing protein At5g66520 [Magnolia sinica]|uniref:pentatricopeptide repeat-containing protein At5g66520 n=1 Tax=Magnolia sinica TaxID=86752 RepID=UPI00265B2DFC|nr:pentatricopeptide repeat-containing protein At5g66520 [Magnolia sinica]
MAASLLPPANQILSQSKAHTLSLLERCSDMEKVKQVHAQMIKTGFVRDIIPASRLLSFCIATSNSCSLAYARMVFNGICQPNTFMWNTMIRGYSNSKDPKEALILYCQMLHNSAPLNAYTFPFLLKSCANLSALEETQQIHCQIIKNGFGLEVFAANSLLHVYVKSGCISSARQLFDRIPHRDTVSWNSMINGYAKNGEIKNARELFCQMPARNVISWTSMIAGCVECGLFKEALNLFQEMQVAGIEPDNIALVSALSACAQLGALDQGRWIHAYIDKNQISIDPILSCILVDMYAKCGDVEEAFSVFTKIEDKSVAAWTAMITGFATHGRGREALELFMEMKKAGIKPNEITFTGVLTACSYAGLVEEGKLIFKSMKRTCDASPLIEHYGCMVDLLGRAGLLKEAEELIETMPMKPNAAVWGALLRACHIHGNYDLGMRVGNILIKLDPGHGGRYVHLASVFAAAGKWNEAVMVRKLMKDRGVSKLPGCSLIDLNGTVHEFFAGDQSHPNTEEIYYTWDRILERLRQEGYVPTTENLLLDLEEEEKEAAIHHHSEKLAIAFGLINTNPGTTIRVIKNLRVCKDCHTATKLISKVYACEIVVRDRTRFHLFKDGNCSCRDYW